MHTHRSQGFTLIELLVVIAIIGILSAVVLASLNTARQKGNDAAIQSNLSAIATQAEIWYSTNDNKYSASTGSICTHAGSIFADGVITKAINATVIANGGTALVCGVTASGYAVQSVMQTKNASNATQYWCIDSSGQATKATTALGAGATTCPS
ncbi:MAG: prepilin-type N-terminal cleavage/methylation domain-containing protein [Candidatus Parcubacteria bacterium]|nr:prepilin-type N-terminal cleavage/methylation domain-containing protein [Candidatus Parcubacteria bacterium]